MRSAMTAADGTATTGAGAGYGGCGDSGGSGGDPWASMWSGDSTPAPHPRDLFEGDPSEEPVGLMTQSGGKGSGRGSCSREPIAGIYGKISPTLNHAQEVRRVEVSVAL